MTDFNGLSPADLLAALDANFVAYGLACGRFPGGEAHVEASLAWFSSGIPEVNFNGVIRARLAPAEIDATIERVLAEFRRRDLPFFWQIGPTTKPATLGESLARHGFVHDDDEPGMVLDLEAMNEDLPMPAGLSIETVTDDAGLRDWIEVWGCGAPLEVRERWWELYGTLGLAADPPWSYFLGRWNGELVATVKLFYAAGIAVVHHVVTLPELRQRGIGTALTVHACREARARGYRIAGLTASPLGINAYKRIGFRAICRFQRYRWEPEDR